MSTLFTLLFLLSLVLLIVGLIRPRIVLIKGNTKIAQFGYRKSIALVFGFSSLLFFILIAVTAPEQPPVAQQPKQDTIQAPVEQTSEQQVADEAPESVPEEAGQTGTSPEPSPQTTPQEQSSPLPEPSETQPTQETTYAITYVVDGDTVELADGTRVRLLGINTSESGQPYFSEARNKMIELVLNKEVRLEQDISDTGLYGRLLRYIYVGNTFVNLEMVRLGYANSYTYPPDVKYQTQLLAAEQEARDKQLGLWKPAESTPGGSVNVTVTNFNADAAGNDHQNLNDEYFTLKNNSSNAISMTGWTAKDAATHIYTFPSFTLNTGASVTIYTGSGTNTAGKLYWGSGSAIWNNSGDTLYLRDGSGDLVLEYGY